MLIQSKKAIYALLCCCVACATPGQVDQRLDTWQDAQREEVEALKRAVESSYDRERAMADRLRQGEEDAVDMRQQIAALRDEIDSLRARLDSLHTRPLRPAKMGRGQKEDALSLYQNALAIYNQKQYEQAVAQFDRVLAAAPYGEWADNAQYWKGECYYGLGQFRQALTEFTKVFAFSKTEKADDAQLKVGRCYLALGEQDQAIAAFRKLLSEFSESEYVAVARKELKYLGGQ
ncbi:MAG: tetratricopeptide repeat protein [Candidatus Latescibacterota bacterium]|nr:tetratricopeptide repeat protein [Candidatus Latescibacterota bacterium]MEE2726685.1 tetratricopeptide repeat protein [Candidatus Latescibacterota bacterium]